MNHDELLAKLTPSLTYSPSMAFGAIPILNSLRAVVELHYEHIGGAENAIYCYECSVHYPCPTIQAIERELA